MAAPYRDSLVDRARTPAAPELRALAGKSPPRSLLFRDHPITPHRGPNRHVGSLRSLIRSGVLNAPSMPSPRERIRTLYRSELSRGTAASPQRCPTISNHQAHPRRGILIPRQYAAIHLTARDRLSLVSLWGNIAWNCYSFVVTSPPITTQQWVTPLHSPPTASPPHRWRAATSSWGGRAPEDQASHGVRWWAFSSSNDPLYCIRRPDSHSNPTEGPDARPTRNVIPLAHAKSRGTRAYRRVYAPRE